MARARSLDDVIALGRIESTGGGARFVDLRLDFELEDVDRQREVDEIGRVEPVADRVPREAIEQAAFDAHEEGRYEEAQAILAQTPLTVGARWDRHDGEFSGEAGSGVVVRFHPGQLTAVKWFSSWLDAHAERRENPPPYNPDAEHDPSAVYSALFAGGRRGGKSWIAVAFAVAYAIRFPHAIIWLVSPSNERHAEIRRYIATFVAAEWLDNETAEGWELCNGSQLVLKSAFGSGDQLKEGKANFVVLNEGQKMAERAYVVSRGAIVDSSGLVLVCANPPVELKDQQWVSTFAADATAHRRASVYVHFNPLLNPHIDRGALLSLEAEVDERTYQIEVLGMFLTAKDAVAYNWVRLENEAPKPHDRFDVTSRFLEGIGEGEGILRVVGLDVQRFPYIGGPVYQFFGSVQYDRVLAWIVDEVVLDGGDEADFCAELTAKGFAPEQTLIVCDASGRYQHSRRRSADSPAPEWRGKGSFDIIRGEGFTRIVPPDRRQKRNPQIIDRARAFTSLIATKTGARRLFCDTDLAPRTAEAIRDWRTKHGTPSRTQTVAHLGDGASYPIVRFFPRRLRSGDKSTNPRDVNDLADRIDGPRATDPAAPPDLRILPSKAGRPRRSVRTRGL